MNTEYHLLLINIHCVTHVTDVKILTFPVFDTSCCLHVFMAEAENSIRSLINNIGAVEQARFRKDGRHNIHNNIELMRIIPVGFLDSKVSFGVTIFDLVIYFRSNPSILLDSEHNKQLIGMFFYFILFLCSILIL